MKRSRFISALIATVMMLSCISMPSTAQEGAYSAEFSKVASSIAAGKHSGTLEFGVDFEGKSCVKVTPTPHLNDGATTLNVDCYKFSASNIKPELAKYKYIGVTYYYKSDNPTYSGKLGLNLLSGNSQVVAGTIPAQSSANIVANKWAEAIFDFSGKISINPNAKGNFLSQCHFFPFGTTKPEQLSQNDVIYLASFTFYEEAPSGMIVEQEPSNPVKANPTVEKEQSAELTEDESLATEPFEVDFGKVFSTTRETTTVEKNVEKDGVVATKLTVNPSATGGINADCWSFAQGKVELSKYRYVGVTYYYDTKEPSFRGKMTLNLLAGSTKLLTSTASAFSESEIETGKWAEAIFNFSGNKLKFNPSATSPYLSQCHFYPFGSTSPTLMTENDVIYISKFTFYPKNPNPNAVYKADFYGNNPDAKGNAPQEITFKEGEQYTLPESTYTLEGYTFAGWKDTTYQTKHAVGDVITGKDASVTYSAIWEKNPVSMPEFVVIDFPSAYAGIANGTGSAELSVVAYEGKNVVKVVPNPSVSQKVTGVNIDGWQYGSAGADLNVYKWMAVTYKYESPNPKDFKIHVNYMVNGGILTGVYGNSSEEKVKEGEWNVAILDMTGVDKFINKDADNNILKQMHFYPYYGLTPQQLSEDDVMYINRVMFFKNKPSIIIHEPYMTGYNDGTFKPNKTMSRAEACTVVARVLAPENEISGTCTFADVTPDKWFAKYVGFCEAKGLLKSYSGNFEPNKEITRAEFAELVYNTGLASDTDEEVSFSDVTKEHPKYSAIKAAASAKLINGYEDKTFRPDRTITRAQVVTIINRARGREVSNGDLSSDFDVVFLDVASDNWAFAAISEASLPHIENDGKWLCFMRSPADMIGENGIVDYKAGSDMVAKVDALAEKRKAEIRATESDYSTISGTKYYVSNSGNDSNDGKSPETALATIAKANSYARNGDGVLLERGGLWRERFVSVAGVTYSAYGSGDKPKLYGSHENATGASNWLLHHEDPTTGAKIWKYVNEGLTDVGAITFDDGAVYALKEVPSYYNGRFVLRKSTSTPFDEKIHLTRNYSFFHKADSVISSEAPNPATATGPIYLRCDDGNPGELHKVIEFNTRGHIISVGGANCTFDNLCIMYGGSHGIGAGSVEGLTVKNCEIGWIGGTVQSYNLRGDNNGVATRFGNGVEIYGNFKRYSIINCYVYQNYDAGITHQDGRVDSPGVMDDLLYKDNLIEDCIYSIEYWYGGDKDVAVHTGKNHLIEGNILRRAGYGFGSTRPDYGAQGHIKTYSNSRNEFSNYVIRNNILDRCNGSSGLFLITSHYNSCMPKMENNTYIQGYGNTFGVFGDNGGVSYKTDAFAQAVANSKFGDATGKVYFVEKLNPYKFPFGE